MSKIKRMSRMEEDVHDHGEVHAVIEEAGAGCVVGEEIEIRQRTTTFDFEAGLITVEDGKTLYRFPFEKVVRWYLPVKFGHD